MVLLAKLISIAIIVYGMLLVLRPKILKKVIEYVKEDNRFYIASGVKTVIGIIFILAAGSCSIPWILYLLGALAAISGIAGFVMKKASIDKLINWVETRPARFPYVVGIGALALGVILTLAI